MILQAPADARVSFDSVFTLRSCLGWTEDRGHYQCDGTVVQGMLSKLNLPNVLNAYLDEGARNDQKVHKRLHNKLWQGQASAAEEQIFR